jgi:hypothetical protein
LKFEKFCHFFEGSIAAPESSRDISLKERNPVDAGREARQAKTTGNEVKRTILKTG